MNTDQLRSGGEEADAARIKQPPTGWSRLYWLGPGFLWMVSAAGSGELLFTPRVGALYGYALIWALFLAVILKWFINREVGRWAVCTGTPILEGFKRLPGPRNWALWVILVPQFFVAVATIAGLASGAATALVLLLPGGVTVWTLVLILLATAFVLFGGYGRIEKAATVFAIFLAVTAVIAAIAVFPNLGALAGGFVPQIPANLDFGEVLPWLGFALSGAAGMMWYSYWLTSKGYGAARREDGQEHFTSPGELDAHYQQRLRGWISQLTLDNTIAVVGTLLIMLAFLILGTELLRPEGLVPAENEVAQVLGRLLGEVFGPVGFWFMVSAVLIGFWSTVLSDQDGFARLFTHGTRLVLRGASVKERWTNRRFLRRAFLLVVLTALPILLFLMFGRPVGLLQLAGGIEAAHIPVLAGLTLYLNRSRLPKTLQPSAFTFYATVLAGVFFAVFAITYVLQLAGVINLGNEKQNTMVSPGVTMQALHEHSGQDVHATPNSRTFVSPAPPAREEWQWAEHGN